MELVTCEVWVVVDENGEYAADADRDNLAAADTALATRLVKIVVKVPKPRPVEVEVTVEAEPEREGMVVVQ